ncbi:MAG: mechanosensitive ion channel [Nanoarchaeota archaeon]|nr:mechanosensitive ion channel [Nanoarchaeota archaeon]
MDIIQLARAIVALIAGIVGGRLLSEVLESLLKKFKQRIDIEEPTIYLFSSLLRYLIYILSFFVAILQFEFGGALIELASFVLILAVIVTLIYSFKDLVTNAISGYYLVKREIIRPGDEVEINGVSGRVRRITEVVIEIETKDGVMVLPNSVAMKRKIIKKETTH